METPYPSAALIDPKMKIKLTKPSTMMCPAAMLAKSRTISTKGLVMIPMISTTGISGIGIFSHQGTPGVFTISTQ